MSEPQDERHPEGERDEQPTTTTNDSTEETRVIETEQPTADQPATEYPAVEQPTAEYAHTSAFAAQQPCGYAPAEQGEAPAPVRPTGPHLPPIVLGLACLVIAGLALAQELGHLQVDWGDVGPLGIVAAGAVLVVLGLVGLLTSRRRES